MSRLYNTNSHKGLVKVRRCRQTGRMVAILNAEQAGYDPTGGRG